MSVLAPPSTTHNRLDAGQSATRTGVMPAPAAAGPRADSLGTLSVLVVFLIGIPSVLVLKPLGAAGSPAGVLGDVLLVLFLWGLISAPSTRRISTPVTYTLAAFALAMIAADFAGMLRPISSSETSSADRGLLILAGWSGIVLTVNTGFALRSRLDRLLLTLVFAAGVLSLIGLLQFFIGLDIASYLRIPGLHANHPYGGLTVRSGFRRISGTALHSIEFGAVLSLILPISFHYALNQPAGRMRRWLWTCVAITGFAIPMTVARSAILGLVIVLALLYPTWTKPQRRRALMIAPFGLVALKAAAPHLIGTLTHLFTQAASDPSVQNRLGDYTAAGYYFMKSPVLGRGFSTFLPEMYRTFDNQYEGMLVEGGLLGLLCLLALIIVPALTALDIRMNTVDPVTRSLAYALMTSMVVAGVTFFTFDAFAFPMCMGVFFLLLGAISCLWRLERGGGQKSPLLGVLPSWQRWFLRAGALMLMLAVLGGGLSLIKNTTAKWQASATVQLTSKPFSGQNVFQKNLYLGDLPQLVYRAVTSQSTRSSLVAQGYADYEVAVGGGSLKHDTDVLGIGDVLTVSSINKDPERASATAGAVLARIKSTLATWQAQAGAGANVTVEVKSFAGPDLGPDPDSRKRAEAMLVLLALSAAAVAYRSAGWLMVRRSIRTRPSRG